jgi:hypothetical protein
MDCMDFVISTLAASMSMGIIAKVQRAMFSYDLLNQPGVDMPHWYWPMWLYIAEAFLKAFVIYAMAMVTIQAVRGINEILSRRRQYGRKQDTV